MYTQLDDKELKAIYMDTLIEEAQKDKNICVVEADLGAANGTLAFKKAIPERFIDVGIAEADAIGVSAGMAACGKIPFVHSFTAFITRRVYDQIAVSCAYPELNVKVVGTDVGITAETNGGTHQSYEDLGIMRAMANVLIFEPTDGAQMKKAVPQLAKHKGVTYMRMNRKKCVKVFDDNCEFELGKAIQIKDGKDVTLIACGIMVAEALNAAELLEAEGISARVINMHTIKPIDEDAIVKAAKETGAIVTCENGNILTGLGGAVAEVVTDKFPVPVKRIGTKDHFGEVGTLKFLKEKYEMTDKDIVKAAKAAIAMK